MERTEPRLYEPCLFRHDPTDIRLATLERSCRTAPLYKRADVSELTWAKRVFRAAQDAAALGDTVEAARLLAEWQAITGRAKGVRHG